MKILFISFFVPYPPTAGHLQRNFNLTREIAKENEIYLITFNQKVLLPNKEQVNNSIKALTDYCKYIKVFDIPCQLNAVKWYSMLFFNLFSTTPFTPWKFHSQEMVNEIQELLKNHKFDLVHIDTVDIARYVDLIDGIPKVLNHHNVESILIHRRAINVKNPFSKIYLLLQAYKMKRFEKKYLNRFTSNLCVSETDIEEHKKNVPDANYELVPNGTDIHYFTPKKITEKSNRIIFAGGMSYYPNADAMEYCANEVFPKVKDQIPNFYMDIIGSHPSSKLKSIAQKDNNIILHGFVNDIRDYLAKAAIYVVPIRIGGGTRLKILDAFACGIAVVSTSIGCEGLNVTPEKNILIGDTPEEFANQIIRIFQDDDLRHKLEINGRKLVEDEYSWEIIGKDLNKVYRSLQ